MSEPMSSIEIEDVLSSIRRLVSDERRPMPREEEAAPAVQAPPALLLTPALRVVRPAPPPEDDVWEEETDWTQDRLVPPGWTQPQAPSGVEPAATVLPPAEAAAPEPVAEQPADPWPAPQDLAELAPQSHRFTLIGASGFEEDVLQEAVASPLVLTPDLAVPGLAPETPAPETPAPETSATADVQPADPAPWAQTVDAFDHIADPVPDQEPVRAEDAEAWADRAAAEAIAGLEAQVADELADAAQGDRDDVIYDESLLRDLVRDILREELAGALGEKITRNVRKLVRAEIAQALATRDLDGV